MAWVRGIKEVRQVTVAADDACVGMKRGPVMMRNERLIIDLPPEAWGRVVRSGLTILPEHTGAGPCGTNGRVTWPAHGALAVLTPLEWSVKHLLEPLRAYYATYVPALHFGPKTGPRGRRAA